MEDESVIADDRRGPKTMIGGKGWPLAFPKQFTFVADRDGLSLFTRTPDGIDAIVSCDRSGGSEIVVFVKVVLFAWRCPDPSAFSIYCVMAFNSTLFSIFAVDGDEQLVSP